MIFRRKPCVFLAVLLAGLTFVLPAQAQSGNTIKEFTVEIVGAGSMSKLLDEHLEIRRHQKDADLTEQELQRLTDITPEQIRELLATEGYFSPKVDAQLDMSAAEPVARFHVEPGEPTTVGTVEIRFKGDIAREEHAGRVARLQRQWSLETGDIFKQSAWSSAKNDLLKSLLVRDYPAARISASEARVDSQRGIADLSVEVDSGPPFTFGELEVNGLERYSRDFVDRLNPIRAGDPFSQEKLNELQARLQETGYFVSAFATIETDREHPDRVPIHLDLNESPRKKLSLGIGFSTDAGPRLEAHWLHRNFLNRDWRLESDLQLDQKMRRIGTGLFLPAIEQGMFAGWLPSYDARFERKNISGELTDQVRVGARVTSPDKRDEKVWGIAYYADRQYLPDSSNGRRAVFGNFIYTKRRLDNIVSPSRGYVASVNLGAGTSGVETSTTFGRVVANANWLSPYYKRWQLVMRGQAAQVFGSSRFDVPGDLLFRTGGDQAVRGYALDSLGVAEDGAVVGGRVLAVASAELVYHFTQQWGAAVFADAGNAADTWKDFKFQRGAGVGVRWRSPIGPINLDLAYGEATQSVRLHFSVGYGF